MDLCARFGEELGMNVVEEFNKLEQKGSIDDYLDAIESLRSLMIQRNPQLPNSIEELSFLTKILYLHKDSINPQRYIKRQPHHPIFQFLNPFG